MAVYYREAKADLTKIFKYTFSTSLARATEGLEQMDWPQDPKVLLTPLQRAALQQARDRASEPLDPTEARPVLPACCSMPLMVAMAAAFARDHYDSDSGTLRATQDEPLRIWAQHVALAHLWAVEWLTGSGGPGNERQAIPRNGHEDAHLAAIEDMLECMEGHEQGPYFAHEALEITMRPDPS